VKSPKEENYTMTMRPFAIPTTKKNDKNNPKRLRWREMD
jgi:hypothetical protein